MAPALNVYVTAHLLCGLSCNLPGICRSNRLDLIRYIWGICSRALIRVLTLRSAVQASSCITCDSEHSTSSPSPHSRLFWDTAFCSSLNDQLTPGTGVPNTVVWRSESGKGDGTGGTGRHRPGNTGGYLQRKLLWEGKRPPWQLGEHS